MPFKAFLYLYMH